MKYPIKKQINTPISKIIEWWEDKLTYKQRNELMTKNWSEIGDTEARRQKLREMYFIFKRKKK